MKREPEGKVIEQFYERYFDSLMIIACSYTRNRDDAMDLVQSTFLKALLSYEENGSFLYWANRVMRNDFYNQRKKQSKIADDPIEDHHIESGEDLLDDYIHNEEKKHLAEMIAKLPEKYRDIMIESTYIGTSDETIAKDRAMSPANVRQIRSRGKKMLIKMMEGEDERS